MVYLLLIYARHSYTKYIIDAIFRSARIIEKHIFTKTEVWIEEKGINS